MEEPAVSPAQPARWRSARLDALLLLVLAFLAFVPALGNGWIWDDDDYIHQNPLLETQEGFEQIWLQPSQSLQWYPMVFTTFWIEHKVWGDEPLGYHLVNILLHGLGAVLAWRVLRRLRVPGAWLAAALWAVHPVMVESVAWATERKNVLSGVFYLGAALAFLAYVERLRQRRPAWGPLAGALALFAGALFSKTVTASLPAALLLVLWMRRERLRDWRILAPLLVMVAGGLAMGLFTAHQEVVKVRAVGAAWEHGFDVRVLVAGRALWFYLQKLLVPWPLVFIYERWEVDPAVWWQWVFPAAALALAAALFLLRRRLGRGPLVAALVFGGTLFPALGFFDVYPHQFSWVADHFQYHASLAALALVSALLVRLPRLRDAGTPAWLDGPFVLGFPRRPLAVAAPLLGVLAVLSATQTTTYRDWKTIWTTTLDRNPKAWIAANNLGFWYMNQQPPDFGMAERYLREGIAIHPANSRAHGNLATILLLRGNLEEAEEHYRAAIAAEPDYFRPWLGLGEVLYRTGRARESAETYRTAIEKCRLTAAPRFEALPGMHFLLGQSEEASGRLPAAREAYAEELRLYPQGANVLRARTGQARVLAREGRSADAIAELEAILEQDADWGPALQALAWIRACHADPALRDPERALAIARRLVKSAGRRAIFLDLLGAAQAAAGRMQAAERTAAAAVQAARQEGNAVLAEEAQQRRGRYAAGEPFRSPTGLPRTF